MYVSTQRLVVPTTSVLKCMFWLSLGTALALSAQTVLGQDNLEYLPRPEVFRAQYGEVTRAPDTVSAMPTPTPNLAQSELGDVVQDGLLFGDQLSGRTGEAYGALFRAGVWTGPAVGRTDTIVPLEIMPYGFINNAMVFGSLRGFRAASDGWGMNLGGGLRYYADRWDRIFGVNAYYDYDNSSGGLFREVGFGLESLGQLWDMRANAYIPNATTQRLLKSELVDGSQRFSGHQLLYDNLLTYGNALRGVDWEAGVPIPGRIPMRHNTKIFGGAYYYEGSSTKGFTGWKARAQLDVVQNLNISLEVLNDKVFDTSVVFGATWTYGGYKQPEEQRRTQFDRMTEMVRRNYNIVVAQLPILDADKVAINPLTNNPYFFEHVASYANTTGMDGTVDHPWQNLTQAQAALNAAIPVQSQQAGNIIYVHANSVYNSAPDNTVTLIPTVRILGEGNGVIHRVNVPGLGPIVLPRATTFANRPIFSNQTGNAVTLVSGTAAARSEFSGFQIGDPTATSSGPAGIGIFGDGVANVIVNQTDVNFAQGDGVFLNNLTGPVFMLGDRINNIGNTNTAIDSFHVVGGTGKVFFGTEPVTLKRSVINNTGGYAVEIDAIARGGTVDMTGSDINDGILGTSTVAGLTGGGIRLHDIDGVAIIDNATIVNTVSSANTTGRAIDIEGTAGSGVTPPKGLGQISFVGGIAIDNPEADAIRIANLQADTSVTPNLVSSVRFTLPSPTNGVLAPGIRITNRNAGGLTMLNNAGSIAVLEPISITTSGTPTQAAIDYEGSSGSVAFLSVQSSSSPNQILISGGGGNGIQIGATAANTGSFRVTGTTNIQQIAGTSLLIGDPNFLLTDPSSNQGSVIFGDVSIDLRGERGIEVVHVDHLVQFTGLTQVGNSSNSLFSAVDIHDNLITPATATTAQTSGDVTFRTLNILAAQSLFDPTIPQTILPYYGGGLNITDNPSSVAIQTLNINQNSLIGDGMALYVNNAGTQPAVITTTSATPTNGLSIGAGNIISQGGPAVYISNSVIGVNLTSVSSTNSLEDGIHLENNVGVGSKVNTNGTTDHPFIFAVNGTGTVFGSGGLIQGSVLDGAYILNSEGVSLRNMDFTGNHQNGIYATTPALSVINNRVTGNDGYGINVYAVAIQATSSNRTLQTSSPIFTMLGSTVSNNGQVLLGTQEVLFTAATLGNYTVNLGATGTANQNIITHPIVPVSTVPQGILQNRGPAATATMPITSDGILIRSESGAIGSTLNLSAINNIISVTRPTAIADPLAALRVSWNGAVATGAVQGNTFNFGADVAEGLVLDLQSTTLASNFRIAGNTFNSPAGIGTTGIDVTTNGGAANIQIGNLDGFGGNLMTFIQPTNGIVLGTRLDDEAMRFNLGANSFVNVFTNTITMTGTDLEAMQFTSVAGPSTVQIDNNLIDLNGGLFNLYGIRFLSITQGTLRLQGTTLNDVSINGVTGSTFPWFFAPTTGTIGQININGTLVP
eukprot:TRINITY_DN617_c2_g1_i2.p1 TRINITY_DN617_c2_g1~~TRINITY_DN617_c2_g1_i2.p1  ORF type:complete len:1481 (-),score=339.74 TRINITY_DN617_c2_g1_i2:57-4499(-)